MTGFFIAGVMSAKYFFCTSAGSTARCDSIRNKVFITVFRNDFTSESVVSSNKQPVKNQDLWKRLLKAKEPHSVKFIWVKGHNGHEFNERCDQMAVASANSGNNRRRGPMGM